MRKRWRGCLGGLSCFGKQKGGKRIVPASRIPEANSTQNQPNGAQVGGLSNQNAALLAPPSSPASFSNSALPSTVQSPSCFLSANSPGGPSSNMYATGPYAHETQLVSPPVFSTFTTEPSTAPLTPPPELAHLTTPSSPDVPYAQFLTSSASFKNGGKTNYVAANDPQAAYSLFPGSPASALRSPVSRASRDGLSSSFPDREFSPQWDPSSVPQDTTFARSESGRLFGLEASGGSKKPQDSNFFCPATFAQYYLDPSSFPQSGGRLSVSKESDAYSNGENTHQNRQTKTTKQDVEELEAYRASFGFSADEIIITSQYVEISDVLEDSFSMTPFPSSKHLEDENGLHAPRIEEAKAEKKQKESPEYFKPVLNPIVVERKVQVSSNRHEANVPGKHSSDYSARSASGAHILSDDEDIFSKMGASRINRKYHLGLSSSDAEIEYRRGRSLKQRKGDFAWHD
ncbi:OLC1v1016416C1 [Oldenlandia corymbosa var. corymbosa]|uniref:OLC1v1016416C1 n=1 Tax=Oldenlandia corymbosa var. corymbosa TaxID=529605 RepID=A0AAV1E7F5_OLDCO|nr:OLC1v1016416C1 [Oldenlandia corymbosa var. corymbosa]